MSRRIQPFFCKGIFSGAYPCRRLHFPASFAICAAMKTSSGQWDTRSRTSGSFQIIPSKWGLCSPCLCLPFYWLGCCSGERHLEAQSKTLVAGSKLGSPWILRTWGSHTCSGYICDRRNKFLSCLSHCYLGLCSSRNMFWLI